MHIVQSFQISLMVNHFIMRFFYFPFLIVILFILLTFCTHVNKVNHTYLHDIPLVKQQAYETEKIKTEKEKNDLVREQKKLLNDIKNIDFN